MITTDYSAPVSGTDASFRGLLLGARAGNRESLGKLLQWYANYLRLIATRRMDTRLRKRLNPSDVVQEAMLAAHRDFQDFRGNTKQELCCWLRSILIHSLHRSFDRNMRVGKRDLRREISIDAQPAGTGQSLGNLAALLPSRGDSPSAAMKVQDERAKMDRMLQQLSEDHRRVIELRIYQGKPFAEIAKDMNRTSGAVRMLWLRALEAFKEHVPEV